LTALRALGNAAPPPRDGGNNRAGWGFLFQFQQNKGFMSKPPECQLIPVHATDRCAGHLRRTARGFLAYDCNDKPIGIFTSTDDGAAALLALSGEMESD
jgi:hypothetical protein